MSNKNLLTVSGVWLEHQNEFVTTDGELIDVFGFATTNQQFTRPLRCMMLLELVSFGYKIINVLPIDEEM